MMVHDAGREPGTGSVIRFSCYMPLNVGFHLVHMWMDSVKKVCT